MMSAKIQHPPPRCHICGQYTFFVAVVGNLTAERFTWEEGLWKHAGADENINRTRTIIAVVCQSCGAPQSPPFEILAGLLNKESPKGKGGP